MDPSLYTTVATTRGFKYSVYQAKCTDPSKPTLLFIHGFPSSSYDWRHQVEYFKLRGHGIIVPDMLGYGNTDKPTDAEAYGRSLISKDLIEVLDALRGDGPVVAIAHDWGSTVASRLANLYADRFIGFAFLAVGYSPPNASLPYAHILAHTKQLVGYELIGYWSFFSEDRAVKILNDNFDAFFSSLIALDFESGKTNFAPTGAFEEFLQTGKIADIPSFLTEEEYSTQKEILLKGGLAGPLCWYKSATSSVGMEESKSIPLDKYSITLPVFFGAANNDPVALAALQKAGVQKLCSKATIKEYGSGHWVIWEAKDKINADLGEWIEGL